MSEIIVKEGQTPKKKKGLPGIVKFFIGFFITIFVIAGLLVAAVFICFFDNSHQNVEVKANYSNEAVINEVIVDSLDETVSTKKMKLALTENQLNQVLFNAYSSNDTVNQYVKNFYVAADNGKYNFNVELDAKGFFKTKLVLVTNLEITEEDLIFKVNDVKVGRISGVQNILGTIKQFITIPDLDSALANSGLHMHFDIDSLSINYKLNDFYNDLVNLMGTPNEYSNIFSELIMKQELRTIEAIDKTVFGLNVNIDKLQITHNTHGLEGFTVQDGYFTEAINNVKNNVIELLNNNKIKEEDAQVVARYMIGEELILEDNEKTIIHNYNSSGTFDAYAANIPYYDYTEDNSENLKNVAKEQIEPQMIAALPGLPSEVDVEFDTDMIDAMFKSSTALGKINTFVRNKGTDSAKDYKLNYVVIDRVSTLVKDNKIYFMLSVNLNGCAGEVSLKTTKLDNPAAGFGVMELRIDEMLLGDIAVSENTKIAFLKIIDEALINGAFDERFSINNGVVTLNLKKTMDENGVLETLGYSTSFELMDASISGDTYYPGNIHVNADR